MPKNVNTNNVTQVTNVVTGRRRSGTGCLAVFLVLLAIAVGIKFWFVLLPIVIVALVIYVPLRIKSNKEKAEVAAAAAQADAEEEALAKDVRLAKLRNQQHKLDKEFYADDPSDMTPKL